MVACAAMLVVAARAGAATSGTPAPRPAGLKTAPIRELDAQDAELLAQAVSRGAPAVTLLIATDEGKAPTVADQIDRLGGTVARRFDRVGFVLARVPTEAVEKAAKLSGVVAIDLDQRVILPQPERNRTRVQGARHAADAAGPGAKTPAANPYLPTGETGSVAFKRKHPTWDGRGVTIGIMDSGVDLDHPALQRTTTGDRKIADWVTTTDPVVDADPSWRAMVTRVSGPNFSYADATWTAPAGTWEVDRFTEAITRNDDAQGDVNRDGDTTDVWGVLYDPATHDIRVDVNQNHDFTDDAVLRPYREKHDVGHFGTDKPGTPVVERMPFVVEYREDVDASALGHANPVDFVNIGLPVDFHGTHVAGIAAGNDMFGNTDFDGQAPGAKLVSARVCSWGGVCSDSAVATGLIDLVENRDVDVVNLSIGGLPPRNDGNSARARLFQQLIDKYGVQLFVSAGNFGPGVNTVGDPSIATDVVSVGASISKDTWRANYGTVVAKDNALFTFSPLGPREDGGLKPNLAAPGSAISTTPTWHQEPAVPEAGYALPNGYAMANGTSMASPQATGGAALLLSAGRATHREVTAPGLRRALYSSADPIEGVSVAGQGNGLMDVPGAWSLLSRGVQTRTYTSAALVCSSFSDDLPTPGRGVGIVNRCASGHGGLTAGRSTTYDLTLTRTSGPEQAIRHTLATVGDRSAFRGPAEVSLPLNRPVTVPVVVTPEAGLNAAILKVDDPDTSAVDFEVLATVVVGAEPAKPSFTRTFSGSVPRASTVSYYVTVPEGADALQINLSGVTKGSQTRWRAFTPWGVPVENYTRSDCYTNLSDEATCASGARSYANPMPGIWELAVESRPTSPVLSNPFTLTAKVQGVTVEPAMVEVAGVATGSAAPVTWTVKNDFGPLRLKAVGAPLGSALTKRPTVDAGDRQQHTVEVPAGAERLDVAIGGVSDRGSDLDLAVYRGDVKVAESADADAEESVSIPKPEAGTYTVVVDGFTVPSGSTQYDYREVFLTPALGRTKPEPGPLTVDSGAAIPLSASVLASSEPEDGRTLYGEVTLVTDQGAQLERGTVAIGKVE
ncbi:S8 family serine peptidase [Actinoplanes sp. NPDC049548]|uniref:S8 family serine peptidase n=1 Tax=Actinoplanes sp. NPDC049548 TaxID=3155152 RepID=UPI0034237CEA